jgi:hypothetical protein
MNRPIAGKGQEGQNKEKYGACSANYAVRSHIFSAYGFPFCRVLLLMFSSGMAIEVFRNGQTCR